jgi:hypothetical protein
LRHLLFARSEEHVLGANIDTGSTMAALIFIDDGRHDSLLHF